MDSKKCPGAASISTPGRHPWATHAAGIPPQVTTGLFCSRASTVPKRTWLSSVGQMAKLLERIVELGTSRRAQVRMEFRAKHPAFQWRMPPKNEDQLVQQIVQDDEIQDADRADF